jgi:hypothetical protein
MERTEVPTVCDSAGCISATSRTARWPAAVRPVGRRISFLDQRPALPSHAVEDAEVLGRSGCGDHSHPVVRFGLAEPRDSDPWERHLLVRSLAFNEPFDFLPGGVRTKTGTTEGTANPCQDCVRRCMEFVGDPEAFRDCILHCPC